jgi:hypothetical protein
MKLFTGASAGTHMRGDMSSNFSDKTLWGSGGRAGEGVVGW